MSLKRFRVSQHEVMRQTRSLTATCTRRNEPQFAGFAQKIPIADRGLWLACGFLRFRGAKESLRFIHCRATSRHADEQCHEVVLPARHDILSTFLKSFQRGLHDLSRRMRCVFFQPAGDAGEIKELRAGDSGTQRHDRDSSTASFRPQGFTEMEDVIFTGGIGGHKGDRLKRCLRRHIDNCPVPLRQHSVVASRGGDILALRLRDVQPQLCITVGSRHSVISCIR